MDGRSEEARETSSRSLIRSVRRAPASIAASDFTRKVGETLAARVIGLAAGGVATVIAARLLGPEGRGLYAVAAAVGAIGISFASLGLQSSNTYFVARDRSLLPTLLGNTLAATLCIVPLLVMLLGIVLVLSGRSPVHGALLALALVSIPLGLAYLLFQNLLLGVHEIRRYNVIEVSTRLFGLLLLVGLAAGHVASAPVVFATSVAASAAAAAWAFSRLLKLLDGRTLNVDRHILGETMRYGLRAYLGALFAFLLLRSDILIVRYKLGTIDAGFYSVSVSLADLLYVLPAVVGTILFPRLATMHDRERQWRATGRVAVRVGLAMAAIAIAAWPLASPVVRLLFGPTFAPAARAFAILATAMVFYGVNNVISTFAASSGFPWFAVYIWVVGLALNVALNLVLIPRYGISGSAVASLVAYAVVGAAQVFYFGGRTHARTA